MKTCGSHRITSSPSAVNSPKWASRDAWHLDRPVREKVQTAHQYPFLFQEATAEDDVEFDEEEELVEETE
jgi:hypothetical protein